METSLYYLQSRYYDPEIGRFINADGLVQTPTGSVLSANMFAYCENNPVNMVDPSGCGPYGMANSYDDAVAKLKEIRDSILGITANPNGYNSIDLLKTQNDMIYYRKSTFTVGFSIMEGFIWDRKKVNYSFSYTIKEHVITIDLNQIGAKKLFESRFSYYPLMDLLSQSMLDNYKKVYFCDMPGRTKKGIIEELEWHYTLKFIERAASADIESSKHLGSKNYMIFEFLS